MASLVGAFAASHGPLLIREWEALPQDQKLRLKSGFEELGRRISAARPDVLIVVSPDHWSNFFLDNYPAVCLGVGAANEGPPERRRESPARRCAISSRVHVLRNSFTPASGISGVLIRAPGCAPRSCGRSSP